ncbi:MAG: tryptophan 7-halogenase [Planctomycetota bacterium]|nr:tryptophan 7-halogenase [Planctomycetota bacterium]
MPDLDVVIVGAGPAGTTAAAVLAEHGRRVAVLEREAFPRYRIGESLIPYCWFALDRLGLADRMETCGFTVPKHSVQFVSTNGKRSRPFYFFQHDEHPSSHTWQVVRSDFDRMLRDNALAQGAVIHEGTAAKDLLRSDAGQVVGVRAEGPDGSQEFRAPLTIDASGRDLFAASKNRWRVGDQELRKVAIWTYFEDAQRDPGLDEGATTIAYLPHKGWFWYLPLAGGRTSVGIVGEPDYLFREGKDFDVIFQREVAAQPWIAEHLRGGTRCADYQVTHDFSYRAKHSAEDGLVLVGDALAFLDPVFSSGVYFALNGGVLVADAAHAALTAGDVSASRFAEYTEVHLAGVEAMRSLVHAFYDPGFRFSDFFKRYPSMRRDVTDVLIGRLDKDFSALFTAMQEFAQIPGHLPHGRPLDRGTSHT